MSNSIDQLYELPSAPFQGGLPVSMTCQQCRTPSTRRVMMVPSPNNVELHRQPRISRWRLQSTMSNSIDSRTVCQVQQCRTPSTSRNVITMVPSVNNVELHRQSSQQCRTPSTPVSNVELHRQSSQQCRTPSTIQDDPSCVQS